MDCRPDHGYGISYFSKLGSIAERPSSSIITGREVKVVQQRFSMREEIIDKDERMLVSMTRTVYLAMMDKWTHELTVFLDAHSRTTLGVVMS